jgi:hypothetical protein
LGGSQVGDRQGDWQAITGQVMSDPWYREQCTDTLTQ